MSRYVCPDRGKTWTCSRPAIRLKHPAAVFAEYPPQAVMFNMAFLSILLFRAVRGQRRPR